MTIKQRWTNAKLIYRILGVPQNCVTMMSGVAVIGEGGKVLSVPEPKHTGHYWWIERVVGATEAFFCLDFEEYKKKTLCPTKKSLASPVSQQSSLGMSALAKRET